MSRPARIGETPRTRASEAAAAVSCRRTVQRFDFIESSFSHKEAQKSTLKSAMPFVLFVLSEPAVRFEEPHADATFAIELVGPGTVNFGSQSSPGGLDQCYLRSYGHVHIDHDCRAGVADFYRRACGLKSRSEEDTSEIQFRGLISYAV